MEWLKEILGESYTEEIEKAVSAKIGKDFVSRSDFNAKNEKVKALEGQIAQRDEQLENLKKVDAEGLQAQIAKLQQENADKKAEYERNLEQVQFNHALDNALTKAKARDTKAVKALLTMEDLKLKNGEIIGLNEQLETLKGEKDYLFHSEKKTPKFADKTPGIKPSGITQEQFGKMGYTERLKLKQTSPETYKALRDGTAGQEEGKDN